MISSQDVPGFGRASMDGYAVISQDTIEAREDRPVSLRLAGSVPMGRRPEIEISRGEAAEVSTGSMMPKGADAVVMIEYSLAQEGIGASLQHYNPLIDNDVAAAWGIPANWKLRAQMPFGANEKPFPEKSFMDDAARFKVFG